MKVEETLRDAEGEAETLSDADGEPLRDGDAETDAEHVAVGVGQKV